MQLLSHLEKTIICAKVFTIRHGSLALRLLSKYHMLNKVLMGRP